MMQLNREQIDQLVEAITQRLTTGAPVAQVPAKASAFVSAVVSTQVAGSVTYATLDQAVTAAKIAQVAWVAVPMERRKAIIAKIREKLSAHVEELSRLAVD